MSGPPVSAAGRTDQKGIIAKDLLSITYGCFVQQLTEDYGDPDVVSSILHSLGKNMGLRMSDEVLAKTKAPICSTYPEYMKACASVCFFSSISSPGVFLRHSKSYSI